MIYERVMYMCPKCCQIHFFDKAELFSIICPECDIEMRNMGSKLVSSEQEEREAARRKRIREQFVPIYCPYCNSVDTSKISTTSKVINTVVFGIFGTKRFKQWHCNDCGSDF